MSFSLSLSLLSFLSFSPISLPLRSLFCSPSLSFSFIFSLSPIFFIFSLSCLLYLLSLLSPLSSLSPISFFLSFFNIRNNNQLFTFAQRFQKIVPGTQRCLLYLIIVWTYFPDVYIVLFDDLSPTFPLLLHFKNKYFAT